jgi:uncharacterized protein (DUF1499 family)
MVALLLTSLHGACSLLSIRPPARSTRRDLLVGAAAAVVVLPHPRALAFENSLPVPDAKIPRKPGPAPTDLGIQKQSGNLKPCLDTKPHCFSTASIEDFDDLVYDQYVGDPGLLQQWTFTNGEDTAMADVLAAIKAYPPGQSGVDGGGWKIFKQQPRYVYVQYESLRKGFVDDMEFAILAEGKLSLRSSSRIGRQDKFVNSERVNYFARTLGGVSGWSTSEITAKTHPVYFNENGVSQSRNDDMKRLRGAVNVDGDGGVKGF